MNREKVVKLGLKKVRVTVIPTSNLPQAEIDFALQVYRKRFKEYIQADLSERVLELKEHLYRTTSFGKQYLADALLEVAHRERAGGVGVILTSADIYTGGTNYVFGLAKYGAALVSSARIDPAFWKGVHDVYRYTSEDRRFFESQYAKVLVHELGHAFGLSHCNDWDCVMHYSNSPIELYRKGEWYCQDCLSKLTS